jgi:hypothetical protein
MKKALGSIALCAWIALLGGAGLAGAEESVTFRWAPRDGSHYVLESVLRQTKQIVGEQPQTSATIMRTAISIERNGDGYTTTARPVSVRIERNGQEVSDPVMEALQDVVLVYRIDADGRLKHVDGFENLEDRLREKFPDEVVKSLGPALDENILVRQEQAEWSGRYMDFVGESVTIGDEWKGKAPLTLPSGERIEYKVVTSFPRLLPCGAQSCVEVRTTYAADTLEVGEDGDGKGAIVNGEIVRVIEPDTMQIHSESVLRRLETFFQMPGGKHVRGVLEEERDLVYESEDSS